MKFKSYIYIALLSLLTVSCTKKFLDVNTDPNNPTKVSEGLLLTQSEQTMAKWLGLDNVDIGVASILNVYTHQCTQYSANNKYGAVGSDLSNMWTGIYVDALENLAALSSQAAAKGNTHYVGIAKVLQAYIFSQMVDVFGDVPFSEAINYKGAGIIAPKFDKGSDIYPQLFTMLDTAIINLQDPAENPTDPGTDDVIYNGNLDLWVRAANTIKLKLYNQVRLVQDVSAEVADLETKPLIESTEQSFAVPYSATSTPDNRNPGFLEYTATQRTVYISPWFYEILKGYNPSIFNGIEDPRIPYYFFNQLKSDQPDVEGNTPEYRDGGFVSVYFGSDGPQYASAQDNSVTVMGIYPVGGRYDDGQGSGTSGVGASSGTGAAPFRMITYADRLFIEAELAKAGVLAGGAAVAKSKLEAALKESMKQVDYFVGLTGAVGQSVPTLVGSGPDASYVTNILAYYDSHSSQQMEIILTEKWISAFGGDYPDMYTDHRRTGFPVVFDPGNAQMAPGGTVQPPVDGNPFVDPQPAVKVSIGKNFPLSLPWSADELDANENAPEQKDPGAFKVFWMP